MARFSLIFQASIIPVKGGHVMLEAFTMALAGYAAIFVGAQVVGLFRKN